MVVVVVWGMCLSREEGASEVEGREREREKLTHTLSSLLAFALLLLLLGLAPGASDRSLTTKLGRCCFFCPFSWINVRKWMTFYLLYKPPQEHDQTFAPSPWSSSMRMFFVYLTLLNWRGKKVVKFLWSLIYKWFWWWWSADKYNKREVNPLLLVNGILSPKTCILSLTHTHTNQQIAVQISHLESNCKKKPVKRGSPKGPLMNILTYDPKGANLWTFPIANCMNREEEGGVYV